DTRLVALPFAFPFFGAAYNQIYVNSDGNLTFTVGDTATDRSVGRMAAGPPRIAPLFDDLNPSQTAGGVRVFADSTRLVVSWVGVPEYAENGQGAPQTFQVRLYPDGRIEFSYSGVTVRISSAVVGIAPGGLKSPTTMVHYADPPAEPYSGAVAEWFAGGQTIDVVAAAQKFYQSHDDAYDYVVIYNAMGIAAMGDGVIAYEDTVRSRGTGYGAGPLDKGTQYGSASRLQSLINMGPLSQYDPAGLYPVPGRPGDTPLSILAHESGHLFLAFASVSDPATGAQPMLGYGGVHWSFLFNSDASFLEGERIVDKGEGSAPRFVTGATVQHYSLLDQYLMGFRGPEDVDATFVVRDPNPSISPLWHHPALNVRFDGSRQDIRVADVIQAVGRRSPDYTVAQRRFRFGFILLVPQGAPPSDSDLTKLDNYRKQFPDYFAKAADNIPLAETTLARSLKLSLFPGAGVVAGTTAAATLTLQTPPAAPLTVQLQAPGRYVSVPSSIIIPAGAATASFSVTGLNSGVEELAAVPSGASYETAFARVQVRTADASALTLEAVSGDHQLTSSAGPLPDPIVVRLTDANHLPYAGAPIAAVPTAGGNVTPQTAVTDALGQASFRWSPGPALSSQLRLELQGAPAVSATINGGSAAPVVTAVTNAASFVPGVAAGAFETTWGVNLGGGGLSVLLNGVQLSLLYASDTQVNVYVPLDTALGGGTLTVVTPSGARASFAVNITAIQPGIFAVRDAGGGYLEIYCTGLGPTYLSGGYQLTVHTPSVFVGASPATVTYSGMSGFVGLYQVNVQLPPGFVWGPVPVMLSIGGLRSNSVNLPVQ
ncbi:MAG: hypothetical protein LAQ30_30555, partial [Acidobacteriia bacterium]|nr:hypothetical protein [Terriglobia bacterium]